MVVIRADAGCRKKRCSRPISRILFALAPLARHSGEMIIPLVPALLTGSSNLPGDFGRAALKRLPIWFCSVWGFACRVCRQPRGALLPHLFTLTRLRAPCFGPSRFGEAGRYTACLRSPESAKHRGRRRAVYFLCHYPSGFPAWALPSTPLYGVRTFLSPAYFVPPPLPDGSFGETVAPGSDHPANCNISL